MFYLPSNSRRDIIVSLKRQAAGCEKKKKKDTVNVMIIPERVGLGHVRLGTNPYFYQQRSQQSHSFVLLRSHSLFFYETAI